MVFVVCGEGEICGEGENLFLCQVVALLYELKNAKLCIGCKRVSDMTLKENIVIWFILIVQLLLDGGSDVNQKDGVGNTPLHLGKSPIEPVYLLSHIVMSTFKCLPIILQKSKPLVMSEYWTLFWLVIMHNSLLL